MSVVRTLIPKKLALLRREWERKDGSLKTVYRARIWQSKVKRNAEVTLSATDEASACEEAFGVWSKYAKDIEEGRDIGSKHRYITHFVNEFMAFQNQRATDGQITPERAKVIEYSLVALQKFWNEEGKPSIDELARLVEVKWQVWRSKHKAQKTGKPLSARFRNNEMSCVSQFFGWCEDNRYCSRVPKYEPLKLKRANEPYPAKFYNSLLAVSRKEIQGEKNVKHRWNWMNYRYVMILMNGIGCRVVEVKNMKWEDLSTSKQGTHLYIHGKDKERTIQLPERVAGHLNDLRDFKRKNGDGWWDEKEHAYIFSTYKSPLPAKHFDAGVRRRWMEKAGVPNPRDYEYVCFRHKFITESLNAGAHSLVVAKYTGTSQAMIEKTYEGLVSGDVFNLVFKNAPSAALAKKESPKWLNTV